MIRLLGLGVNPPAVLDTDVATVAPMPSDSQRLEKWQGQIDAIRQQIIHLHHQRAIWREMRDAVVASSDHDDRSYFLEHYTSLYVDGASMAVRRLSVETGQRQEISLGILLTDIKTHPCTLNKHVFLERYKNHDDDRAWARRAWLQRGEAAWETEWADRHTDCLDPERITADLVQLRATSEKVKAFADRTVAHIDRRGVRDLPTFADLDTAIDTLGVLFKRYSPLLTGGSWPFLEPAVQGDWKRPFRNALFKTY